MTLPLDPADWASYIPCNENYHVPLRCRPEFKDIIYLQGGSVLLNSATDPTSYKAVPGSIYYNTADETINYRDSSGFQALAVSGAPAPALFPLEAVSATDATQILTSTVLPDGDPTFDLLADGRLRMFNGSGTLLNQFRYDSVDSEWVMEFTNGAQDGVLKLSEVRAESMESVGNMAIVGGTLLQLSTLANSLVFRAANNQIDASTQTMSLATLDCGPINATTLLGTTSLSTPSITTTGAGITLNTKNLTSVGTIGCTTLTASTSVSTPSITTSGTDITFNSKNITNVGTLSAANVNAVSGNLDINASGGNINLNPASTGSTIGNNLRGTIGNSTTGLCPIYDIDNLVVTAVTGTGTISVASIIIPAGTLTTNGDTISLRIYGHTPLSTTGNQLSARLGTATSNFVNLVDSSNGTFWLEFIFKFLTTTSWRQMAVGAHGTTVLTGGAPTTQSTTVDFTTATTLEIRAVQGTTSSIQISAGSLQVIKPSVL